MFFVLFGTLYRFKVDRANEKLKRDGGVAVSLFCCTAKAAFHRPDALQKMAAVLYDGLQETGKYCIVDFKTDGQYPTGCQGISMETILQWNENGRSIYGYRS